MDFSRTKKLAHLLPGLIPVFAALITYAVTWAFVWDEGFHILAARLITEGKRPYLDFCFPQTPLNAFINAGVLLAFGESWRPVHVVAACYLCVATFLVAEFVQSRIPQTRWRTPCALAAAVVFAFNLMVVGFGPCAQAYAIAMMLGAAAFRAALPAVRVRHAGFAFLAGLCAGGGAGSTLLVAPVPLVLLMWLWFFNGQGSRLWKALIYLFGCVLSFAPVIWLYLQGPQQTIFNVIQYQALYRRTNWGDANLHDLDALTNWLTSPQALLLMVLLTAAAIYLLRADRSEWEQSAREFWLAGVTGASLVVFIATAHPTFERYFCVAVPFLAIFSALGIVVAGSRLLSPNQPWLVCGLLIAFGWGTFLRSVFDERDDDHWPDYEEVAQKVADVTPRQSTLFADELIYFLLHRQPEPGLEFAYAEKLVLPPAEEKLYHVRSEKEIKQELNSGQVATFETCRESVMDGIEPAPYFRHHADPSDCDIFWDPKAKSANKR